MSQSNAGFTPTASRPIRSTPDPKLSVVVVWSPGVDELAPFLKALLPQAARHAAEIVVAHADRHEAAEHGQRFRDVTFVRLPHGSTTKQLRAAGMAASGGDVVAILDTLQNPPAPDWLGQLVDRMNLASRDEKP